MKGDTAREFVLLCCVTFFVVQSILPILTTHNSNTTSLNLVQTLPDSITLSINPLPMEGQGAVHSPQLTPFFFEKIPLNSCNKNLLLSVPGIGPSIADSILKTRARIGIFYDMHDLLLVPGIGKSRMYKFAKHLSFANNTL